ncbi:MAG: carotenoid biosynthesis protein [Bacteroidota bacterium]
MNKKIHINKVIVLLIVFYLVGLIGLLIPESRNLFQTLIPLNIFISFVLVLLFHTNYSYNFIFSAILLAVLGYSIELIGVNTTYIFGKYHYDSHLGPQVANVPLLIGCNWFLLVYCSSSLLSPFKVSNFIKAIAIAAIMVVVDLVLEYFAIQNKMWVWDENHFPPLQNFIAWFCISFLFALIYQYFNKHIEKNKLSHSILFIMFFFFLLYDSIIVLNS